MSHVELENGPRWVHRSFGWPISIGNSNKYHTVAVIMHGEYSAVFSWKGESLEEYWDCILNALIHPEDDGKGHRPEPIVYDGGDMNILINEGKKAEDLLIKDGTIPDPISTDNAELKIF